MAKIKIKQVRSHIRCNKSQRRTLDGLSLRKMHQIVKHEDIPQIRGMVVKVHRLAQVVE